MFPEKIEFPKPFVETGESAGVHPASLNKQFYYALKQHGMFSEILVFFKNFPGSILGPSNLKLTPFV